MADALLTQRCYICDAFFSDKVKLGLHIALCYSDACKNGAGAGLPQPAELLNNDKRYTEYMRDKRCLDDELADARRNKVSFATREDFTAMRSQLQPAARQDPPRVAASASPTARPRTVGDGAAPRISGAGHRPPSDHLTVNCRPVAAAAEEDLHSQPAYRFRRGAGGEEAGGVVGSPKKVVPSADPQQRPYAPGPSSYSPPSPQRPPHHLASGSPNGQARPAGATPARPSPGSAAPAMSSEQAPTPSPQGRVSSGVTMLRTELQNELANVRSFLAQEQAKAAERDRAAHYAPNAAVSPPGPAPAPSAGAYPVPSAAYYSGPPSAPPSHYSHAVSSDQRPPSSSGGGSPDGDRACPSCGKVFGKRGYAVHTARCGKHATEDFTHSKDAHHPEHRPEHRIPDEPTRHDPHGGAPPGTDPANWQQFMVTYPRPVLDERPKTAAERASAAAAQAERRRMMDAAAAGGLSPAGGREEPRVPCGRCGRMFAGSRVRQHEAVCVADPRHPMN